MVIQHLVPGLIPATFTLGKLTTSVSIELQIHVLAIADEISSGSSPAQPYTHSQ